MTGKGRIPAVLSFTGHVVVAATTDIIDLRSDLNYQPNSNLPHTQKTPLVRDPSAGSIGSIRALKTLPRNIAGIIFSLIGVSFRPSSSSPCRVISLVTLIGWLHCLHALGRFTGILGVGALHPPRSKKRVLAEGFSQHPVYAVRPHGRSGSVRQPESVELGVGCSESKVAIARTPEEHAIGDGGTRQARTAAGEAP
jgi:hypothetical protein